MVQKPECFPFHTWLPDTYAAAPPVGTTLLSSLLSKTGIYGTMLITITLFGADRSWNVTLMILALCTMVVGGGICYLCNRYEETSCIFVHVADWVYFVWNQYMYIFRWETTGYYGMIFHTANHSIFKLILFTVAGVIFAMAGTTNLNQIGSVIVKNGI